MSLPEFMVKDMFKKPARCVKINSHPLEFMKLILYKFHTQEDLIIVEGELIIHRRAYLRIQRLAKS